MSRGRGKRSGSPMASKGENQIATPTGQMVPYDNEAPQAIMVDPFEIQQMMGYVQNMRGSSPTGRYALREAARAPWVSAIIGTRQNQVGEFSVPRDNEFELGYDIVLAEREATMTKADHREADRIRDLLDTCGDYGDGYDRYTRPDFEAFLRQTVDDSLTLDAYAWEVTPDREGKPAVWHAIDAGTIFRCAPKDSRAIYGPDEAAFCQVVDGYPQRFWPADELCYGIRRPSTDIRQLGYGRSELYDLAYIVQTMLSAWQYNLNIYKNGGMRGVLAIIGAIQAEQLRLVKRNLLYSAQGVQNAHKLTIVNPPEGGDLKWIPLEGLTPSDMEFGNLINAAFLLTCACYSIDPSEVGFYMASGSTGGRAPMFEASPESKLKSGRDKGLRPLLRHIQNSLNRYIIKRINPKFRIKFLGLDAMDEKSRMELDKMRLETYMTTAELRAERNMPPLKMDLSKPEAAMESLILNPTYFQAFQFAVQNYMQSQGGNDTIEVPPGQEPPPDGADQQDGGQDEPPPDDGNGGVQASDTEPEPDAPPAPMAKSLRIEVFA